MWFLCWLQVSQPAGREVDLAAPVAPDDDDDDDGDDDDEMMMMVMMMLMMIWVDPVCPLGSNCRIA